MISTMKIEKKNTAGIRIKTWMEWELGLELVLQVESESELKLEMALKSV